MLYYIKILKIERRFAQTMSKIEKMKNFNTTKRTLSLMSALSLVITSASFTYVSAESNTENVIFPEAAETITVAPENSIQAALDKAKDNTDSEYTEVVLSGGTYSIDLPLKIYSNTIIQAEGATIERTYNQSDKGTGLIRNVAKDGTYGYESKSGKYDLTKNVYINGGTWSGGAMPDTVVSSTNIIFCHADNINLINAKFINAYEAHLMELNAVSNSLIQNCTFDGLKKSNNSVSYMALQLDIAHSYETCKRGDGEHIECPDHDSIPTGYYPDDTACKNIKILSNSFGTTETGFNHFDSACGSDKTLTDGAGPNDNPGAPVYHENINISYNTISNCSSVALASRGHKNVTIKGNKITNSGDKGIIIKRSLGGTVEDNVLTDIGDTGILLFEKSTLPTGNANRNVTKLDSISGNTVTKAEYHGIAIQDESSVADIDGNTIKDAKGHGISVSGSSKITSGIENNTIDNAEQNGINIYDSSSVNTITNNSISNAKNSGIIINKGSSVTGKTSKNIIKNPSLQGIRIADNSRANSIEQNTISGSGENGISLWSNASAASIAQNTVSGSKQNGIVLSTGCKVSGNIEGNTITNSGKNGIFVYSGSSAALIKNNKISNTTSHGIAISTSSGISEITGNSISGSKGNGITVNGKSKVNKIAGNSFSNNSTNCKVSKDSQVAQNDNASSSSKKTKTAKSTKPKVKKVNSFKVKSKKKKTATASWKKLSGIDGYYMEYSLKKNFKSLKTKKIKKKAKNCTIKKLKSKKRYFFRIRAYKKYTVGGKSKTACGPYSAVKKLKIK